MNNFICLSVLCIFSLLLYSCSTNSSEEASNDHHASDKPIILDPICESSSCKLELIGSVALNEEYIPGEELYVLDVWGYLDESTGKEYALIGYTINNEFNYFSVIDVSNPHDPNIVSTIEGIKTQDIKTYKNYAYTVDGNYSSSNEGQIIDLSSPHDPKIVSTFETGHNIFIYQGHLYLASDIIKIFEIANNPEAPLPIQTYQKLLHDDDHSVASAKIHDITIKDGYLYSSNTTESTEIYDLTDLKKPELISTISSSDIRLHHNSWPTEDSNFLFVTDEYATGSNNDISVWDLTDIKDPVLINGYNDENASVHNIMIKDRFAYASYYRAGIKVFEVSDPRNPVLVDEYDTNDFEGETVILTSNSVSVDSKGAWGVYPFLDSEIILLSDDTGLFIFKLNVDS